MKAFVAGSGELDGGLRAGPRRPRALSGHLILLRRLRPLISVAGPARRTPSVSVILPRDTLTTSESSGGVFKNAPPTSRSVDDVPPVGARLAPSEQSAMDACLVSQLRHT